MKRVLLASLILSLTVTCMPLAVGAPDAVTVPTATPVKKAEKLTRDEKRTVTVLCGDEPVSMTVADYLFGVVAAEMPAAFEPEALRAQCVAARTYLQRALRAPKHENADICADPSCCQAYKAPDELVAGWGDRNAEYTEKIRNAVSATDGKYLSYEGEAVLAAFHSSSDGVTEESGALWSPLPYLVSVDTPETAADVPDFDSSLALADIDFRDTVLSARPEADMTVPPEEWVRSIVRDAAGRVESADIGGAVFTGQELRTLFSLRSADFEIEHLDGGFVFTVHGYGHGIGMSQYGAEVMAKNGSDYKEILAHYYPGTVLT